MVEVEELTRRFEDYTAVDGVTFQVDEGEVFGFLGPNGAGKSTTIKMIATLLRPSAGRARVAGFDVVRQADAVRRHLGIIFQDPSLDERLTAEENLVFHAMMYHIPKTERKACIDTALKTVGLQEHRNQIVRTFSGGMKRRLEIARGLLHRPRLLILDEPTVGLDPQTRKTIWECLLELPRHYDTTLFMTTHYMEEAEHCQRIAIIDHGRIIALDTPTALKQRYGGDRVSLATADNGRAIQVLKEVFGVEARESDGIIRFRMPDAESRMAGLLAALPVPVRRVSWHSPTLDDVFLELTGRGIREETADRHDIMRQVTRRRGWR